jgi:hypothetical protein
VDKTASPPPPCHTPSKLTVGAPPATAAVAAVRSNSAVRRVREKPEPASHTQSHSHSHSQTHRHHGGRQRLSISVGVSSNNTSSTRRSSSTPPRHGVVSRVPQGGHYVCVRSLRPRNPLQGVRHEDGDRRQVQAVPSAVRGAQTGGERGALTAQSVCVCVGGGGYGSQLVNGGGAAHCMHPGRAIACARLTLDLTWCFSCCAQAGTQQGPCPAAQCVLCGPPLCNNGT